MHIVYAKRARAIPNIAPPYEKGIRRVTGEMQLHTKPILTAVASLRVQREEATNNKLTATTFGNLSGKASSCSGWEEDPQSFGKIIAEHYVVDTGRFSSPISGNISRCSPDGKRCDVDFPGKITVMVSLANIPNYVIAREYGSNVFRCKYGYVCTSNGRVTFQRRQCKR